MNQSKIQAFYEEVYKEYASTSESDNFDSYERNQVLKRVYQHQAGKKILDLGAGSRIISKFFLSKGYEVYALEWTKAGVQKLLELGVNAIQKDIESVPYNYDDNFFDEVFWGDNIEHLFFPKR